MSNSQINFYQNNLNNKTFLNAFYIKIINKQKKIINLNNIIINNKNKNIIKLNKKIISIYLNHLNKNIDYIEENNLIKLNYYSLNKLYFILINEIIEALNLLSLSLNEKNEMYNNFQKFIIYLIENIEMFSITNDKIYLEKNINNINKLIIKD